MNKKIKIALVGQPNVGKSQLINRLANSNLKVGNFSHTTVEKVSAFFKYKDYEIELIDLPGTYSLQNKTEDEMIANDFLKDKNYDLIINILNSTELSKNLNLTKEISNIKDIKVIMALNMIDEAKMLNIDIDTDKLNNFVNIDVLGISALKNINIDKLLELIVTTHENSAKQLNDIDPQNIVKELKIKAKPPIYKIDKYLMHPILGIFIFLAIMWVVFQLAFTVGHVIIADYLQGYIDTFQSYVANTIPKGEINSLLTDGIIGGVGSVIIFLPDIVMLFLCIAFLEGSGYINRATFMLDGFFKKIGVDGGSFIPLISGFGCSIPAYMATRSLKNRKNKILTMFVMTFMSCSARLPIYLLFVAAIAKPGTEGTMLFLIYFTGALLGVIALKILSMVVKEKFTSSIYLIDIPRYRLPSIKMLYKTTKLRSLMFLKKAGTIIVTVAILIWFVSTYPKNNILINQYNSVIEQTNNPVEKERLENELSKKSLESSYIGMSGKFIEPFFKPLGYDWKLSVSLIAGFAAKEVVVSTIAVLYAMGDSNNSELSKKIKNDLSVPTVLSFLMFVMIYMPCFAATITFTKEIGGFKYTIYLFLFTTITAYILSLLVYTISSMFF